MRSWVRGFTTGVVEGATAVLEAHRRELQWLRAAIRQVIQDA